MSAVLTRPSIALYREEQSFAWWVYALAFALLALGLATLRYQRGALGNLLPALRGLRPLEVPVYLVLGLGIPVLLVVGVLHMTTEVEPGLCRVWFGWFPTVRRCIPLTQVRRVEVVRYRALRDHGFWGARRTSDGEHVLTARGDQAVRVILSDGTRYLIGTQRPDELAAVLERERSMAA